MPSRSAAPARASSASRSSTAFRQPSRVGSRPRSARWPPARSRRSQTVTSWPRAEAPRRPAGRPGRRRRRGPCAPRPAPPAAARRRPAFDLAAGRRAQHAGDRLARFGPADADVGADAAADLCGRPSRALRTRCGSASWARDIATTSAAPSRTAAAAIRGSTTRPATKTAARPRPRRGRGRRTRARSPPARPSARS